MRGNTKASAALVDLPTLPSGWGYEPLAELVGDRGISYGIVQPGNHEEDGVPILRVNNFVSGRVRTDNVMRVNAQIEQKYRRSRLRGGEVLLTVVGANFGACAVAPKELAGWNVARAVAVIPIAADLDPHWVALCLRSSCVRHCMDIWATTTAQPTLNLGDVARLPIPVPPQKERDTIASVLGALDDKIELNRRMNETLEAMCQALFKSWFVDPTANGLPKGWREVPLPEAIEVNPPRRLSNDHLAPYLDMANMPTRSARALEVYKREFGSGMRFKNGDTLVARITPCLENGKTCFVDFLDNEEAGWGSTEYIVLRPKPPLPPEFAYFLARTEEFRSFTISHMTGTTGRQRVPADCFDHFKVAVPSVEVAERFGEFARGTLAKMKGNDNESRTLAELRDTLLPKLLSGELRVSCSNGVPNG